MGIRIIQCDARALPVEDSSVDLVVTSPPYWSLRSYRDSGKHYSGQIGAESTPDEYIDALVECTRECIRVLKPAGSLWINLGDKYATADHPNNLGAHSTLNAAAGRRVERDKTNRKIGRKDYGSLQHKSLIGLPWRYAIRCIDDLGLILRAEVIWQKTNGMPESATDRVRRSHEQWFHFVRQPRYYSDIDQIREVHTAPGRTAGANAMNARNTDLPRTGTGAYTGPNPLGKLPGSVWEIATQPLKVPAALGVDHFAAFPMALPKRIIAAWCPPDGTVLDPFGGTGTTALCADVLGRTGISADASADYCRIAHWRTTDPRQRAIAESK